MPAPNYISDVCVQFDHASAVWENKIYILGGSTGILLLNGRNKTIANSHLRILDFTQSVSFSLGFTIDNITTLKLLPDEIPRAKWSSVWADSGKVYLYGGQYMVRVQIDGNGIGLNTTRPPLSGKVWEYDIGSDAWNDIPDHSNNIRSVTRAESAFDSKGKTQYVLAGAIQDGNYVLGNGSIIPANETPSTNLISMATFNMETQLWTNNTNDVPTGPVQLGEMAYFKSLGAKGALVVIGGWYNILPGRPMDTINIYDIGTHTWYTQKATAQGGNMPQNRRQFCSVSISAVDGTSHNIYIFGGFGQGIDQGDMNTTLDDAWILTMPYFRWVNAGTAPVSKAALSCNLLSERYLVAYRGLNRAIEDTYVCDQTEGATGFRGALMFDITSLKWTREYIHSTETPTYKVPEALYNIIGGDASGGANITAPRGGFVDDKMAAIFQAATKPDSRGTSISRPNLIGACVGGIIGGIVVLAAIVIFLKRCWRKHQAHTEGGEGVVEQGSEGVVEQGVVEASMTNYDVPPNHEVPVELSGASQSA